MKNSVIFILGMSFNAFAIENGTQVNWDEHDNLIKLYSINNANSCSGTIISGKYALTAAHCLLAKNPVSKINTAQGKEINIIAANTHPDYYDNYNGGSGNWHDVAISELSSILYSTKIYYFADLTKNTIKVNDKFQVFGFGRTYKNLNYATFSMVDIGKELDSNYGNFIDEGNTVPGDSGGPWLTNNKIVAVHKGSKDYDNRPRETYSTNLHYSNQLILETINGWHYPTLANTSNGTTTITVQSLHLNPYSDTADYSGDVIITGGTCYGATNIKPFSICTYEIESQGGEGKLLLSNNEVITVNSEFNSESSKEKEGGSFGFLSLISLLFLGRLRSSTVN